jgi:hypothetical protein
MALAVGLLVAGCRRETATEPTTTALGISVTATTTNLSLAVGGSASVLITVIRDDTVSGAVELTADNLPTGITASFSPSTVPQGQTASTLTLTAATAAAAGTTAITVRGSGPGTTSGTVIIQVNVLAPTTHGFVLDVIPSTFTIARGTAVQALVRIERAPGFTAAVDFDLVGLPAEIRATFAPESATESTTLLTLTVNTTVPPGTYAGTVIGSSPGVSAQQAFVTVTVPPSVSGR